jgi:hypothetical protein
MPILHGNIAPAPIAALHHSTNIKGIQTKGDAMTAVIRKSRRALSSVGQFVDGVFNAVHFAHEAQRIAGTPEDVFRARGTTRDQALRKVLSKM